MRKFRMRVALLCMSVLLTGVFTAHAQSPHADQQAREVLLRTKQELTEAYGLLVFEPGVRQGRSAFTEGQEKPLPTVVRRAAALRRMDSSVWAVRVLFEPGDVVEGAFFTVIATTADGQAISSRTEFLSSHSQQQMVVPCSQADRRPLEPPGSETVGAVRATARKRLGTLLDKQILERLHAEERRFGLYYPEPLSAATPLPELVRRIAAVEVLLESQ